VPIPTTFLDTCRARVLLTAEYAAFVAAGALADTATRADRDAQWGALYAGGDSLAHRAQLTDVQGTAATVNLMDLNLLYEPLRPPFLVGPCALYGYWGGSIAAAGFANIDFLVVPSTLITGLS